MQFPHLEFGNPGYLVYQGGTSALVRHDNEPPDYPGVQKYQPLLGAFYGQDDVEWSDLRLRAGLRVEYFSARTTVPSDPANPADSIAGAPPSHPQDTTPKLSDHAAHRRLVPGHLALRDLVRVRPHLADAAAARHLHQRQLRRARRICRPPRISASTACSAIRT